jgi:bifunctional NMN adenylyltransferase/nudix hydrolase
MDKDRTMVLLGRKPDRTKFCFIGGFSQPDAPSLEATCVKEVKEESGYDVNEDDLQYIWSGLVDDWRYRDEVDKIMTALFIGDRTGGGWDERLEDELAEIRWFPMTDFIYEDGYGPLEITVKNKELLVDNHVPIMLQLVKFLMKK